MDGVSVMGRFDDEIFELRHRIASIRVGKTVTAVLRRDSKEFTVEMVPEELGASLGADKVYARWGLSVKEITARMRRELYLDAAGAFVTGVRSTAQQAGLQPNDVILKVGDQVVASLVDLDRVYERMAQEKIPHLKVQVQRGRFMHFASLRMAAAKGSSGKSGKKAGT
jgi:S1-C subfamily serine protease